MQGFRKDEWTIFRASDSVRLTHGRLPYTAAYGGGRDAVGSFALERKPPLAASERRFVSILEAAPKVIPGAEAVSFDVAFCHMVVNNSMEQMFGIALFPSTNIVDYLNADSYWVASIVRKDRMILELYYGKPFYIPGGTLLGSFTGLGEQPSMRPHFFDGSSDIPTPYLLGIDYSKTTGNHKLLKVSFGGFDPHHKIYWYEASKYMEDGLKYVIEVDDAAPRAFDFSRYVKLGVGGIPSLKSGNQFRARSIASVDTWANIVFSNLFIKQRPL